MAAGPWRMTRGIPARRKCSDGRRTERSIWSGGRLTRGGWRRSTGALRRCLRRCRSVRSMCCFQTNTSLRPSVHKMQWGLDVTYRFGLTKNIFFFYSTWSFFFISPLDIVLGLRFGAEQLEDHYLLLDSLQVSKCLILQRLTFLFLF